jgi:hypothetical protein
MVALRVRGVARMLGLMKGAVSLVIAIVAFDLTFSLD